MRKEAWDLRQGGNVPGQQLPRCEGNDCLRLAWRCDMGCKHDLESETAKVGPGATLQSYVYDRPRAWFLNPAEYHDAGAKKGF